MFPVRAGVFLDFIIFILHVHLTQAQTRLEPRCSGPRPFFWDQRVRLDGCPEWTDLLSQQFCVTGLPNVKASESRNCPSLDCGCFWYADEDPRIAGRISKGKAKSGLVCRSAAVDLPIRPHYEIPGYPLTQYEAMRKIFDDWLCESHCVCDQPSRKLWDKIKADQIKSEAGWEFIDGPFIAPSKEDAENNCWEIESVGSTCGVACDSQADCRPGYSCTLQLQKIDPARFRLGDVLALCTAIVRTKTRKKLGGRNLEGGDLCFCNATYIAEACCESRDGQVWNVPEGRAIVIEPGTHKDKLVDLKEI